MEKSSWTAVEARSSPCIGELTRISIHKTCSYRCCQTSKIGSSSNMSMPRINNLQTVTHTDCRYWIILLTPAPTKTKILPTTGTKCIKALSASPQQRFSLLSRWDSLQMEIHPLLNLSPNKDGSQVHRATKPILPAKRFSPNNNRQHIENKCLSMRGMRSLTPIKRKFSIWRRTWESWKRSLNGASQNLRPKTKARKKSCIMITMILRASQMTTQLCCHPTRE